MRKQLRFITLLILSQISYGQNAADVDMSFNIGKGFFDNSVSAIEIQSDGKILIGGIFKTYQDVSAKRIIRLNDDGSIDKTFVYDSGFDNNVNTIAIQSDSKILVGGNFSTYKGRSANKLIRLNFDGSIDNAFSSIGVSTAYTITKIIIQNDGKLLVSRVFTTSTGSIINSDIVRLNANGSVDNTFSAGSGFEKGFNFKIQQDKKIIVAGDFLTYKGINLTTRGIIRLNTDGTLDAAFNPGGTGYYSSAIYNLASGDIALQSDGKIIAVGGFSRYNNSNVVKINRLQTTGEMDNSFNGGGYGFVYAGESAASLNCLALQNDGKVLVGGNFYHYDGILSIGIVRLNNNGSIDKTFLSGGFGGGVSKICLQQDGKILIVGYFTSYNDTGAYGIIRLNGTPVLSNENFEKRIFWTYPNPVKDILNINLLEQDSATEYMVYDVLGKKIISNKLMENKIDISNLSKGIYILKIKSGERMFENKFIKE